MSISSGSFDLTPDQFARLANLARATGKSMPDVLDEALATYHPQTASSKSASCESFFDAASRRGLIGCIHGTPPDLSTNKSYMEGFGQSAGQRDSN